MALSHTGTVEIRTERLLLRRFTPDDAQAMYLGWASDPAVTEYLTWDPHDSPASTRALLEMWCAEYDKPDYYNWAIEFGGEVVGNISVVRISEQNEYAEIGYCLSQRCWGKGIMPEAFSAVIDHLFGRVGFHRICAEHDDHNPKSGRVMIKCGLKLEGRRREAWHHRNGEWHDLVCYATVRDDWREKWLGRCKG